MKTRPFGLTPVTVSELCFATSNFARHADQGQAFSMLDAFRAAGGNFFETTGRSGTAVVGNGLNAQSEEYFARWFQSRAIPRREIVLAARIAPRRLFQEDDHSFSAAMQAHVHASLCRIGTDQLDFLIIDWHESLLPLRRNLRAIDAVIRSGAARSVLLAAFPTKHLTVAHRLLPRSLAGLQLDHALIHRDVFERGPRAFCRENGLGFVARAPLAGGHLVAWPAPPLSSFSRRIPGNSFIATAAHAVWPALSGAARVHGCSPARIALAWALAQADVTSVRISTRALVELNDLLGATELRLSDEEIEKLSGDYQGVKRPPMDRSTDSLDFTRIKVVPNRFADSTRCKAPLEPLFI